MRIVKSIISTPAPFSAMVLFGAVMALGVAGCDRDEGPVEETAEAVDEQAEEAGEAVEEAADEVEDEAG